MSRPRIRVLRLLLFTLLVSIGAVAPSPVAAQNASGKVRDSLRGEARAAFQRGSELFAAKNFGAARVEFERAFVESGERRVLYNVAVCDKELRRYARAIQTLEKSRDASGPALPREYLQRVEETISILRPFVSTLALTVDQPGARVLLDDELLGTTPLPAGLPVDVGEHGLLVQKSGFLDFSRRVTVVSGPATEITVAMDPLVARGELSVRVEAAAGATAPRVLVDGVDVGSAPWSGTVTSGPHIVRVEGGAYVGETRKVEVLARKRTEVTIAVRRAFGRLRVRTSDDAAVIALNGKVVGSGEYDGPLPAGRHELRVTSGDKVLISRVVRIQDGETREVDAVGSDSGNAWLWVGVGGGALVAGAVVTAIVLATRETTFEGRRAGSLPPGVVPTGIRFGR